MELGLFEAVSGPGATAEAVARSCRTSPLHTRALLDALVGLDLLERHGPRYRLEPSAEPFLLADGPYSLLDALRYNSMLQSLWIRLAACVRDGQPALPPGSLSPSRPEDVRGFVRAMHSRALALAPTVLPALTLPPGAGRLLDLAAGPGTLGRLLAERTPGLRVTMFDRPAILEAARELLASSPAADRLSFHPGDYHRDTLPAGFDAILFSGALHQETPETAPALVRALHGALRPGGTLFLLDLMLDADGAHPSFSSLFAINLLLLHPSAHVFPEADVMALLEQAGFPPAGCRSTAAGAYRVIAAVKPGP